MSKLKVLDLFAGIGGFSLGLERTGGFETVAFCEIEEFPRKVLAKHWPEVPIYHDVRELTKDVLDRDGISVDVITGGFPCQDISVAGKQAGINSETRSGLWSEIVRLIGELSPRYVIVENVANLLSGPSDRRGGWFGRILADLAECGYDAEWENIPASAVGAPHRRERVWVVAYAQGLHGHVGPLEYVARAARAPEPGDCCSAIDVADYERERGQRLIKEAISGKPTFSWCQNIRSVEDLRDRPNLPEPLVCRNNDGISARLHGTGNAVVPQIPEMIGRAILEAEAQP
jgi:DNA (cytosine-5)-methyltransferase 1